MTTTLQELDEVLLDGSDQDHYVFMLKHAPEIRAALELRAKQSWQPIETAPKDGTSILGWDGDSFATVAWWVNGEYWSLCVVGAWAEDSEWTPTHWMPLPAPPAQGEQP